MTVKLRTGEGTQRRRRTTHYFLGTLYEQRYIDKIQALDDVITKLQAEK